MPRKRIARDRRHALGGHREGNDGVRTIESHLRRSHRSPWRIRSRAAPRPCAEHGDRRGGGLEADEGRSRSVRREGDLETVRTFVLVDLGSTNGTTINDDPAPIPEGQPVPVHDGDRIHLGAWTTITIVAPTRAD